VLGKEPLELGRELVGGGHGLAVRQQAARVGLGVGVLGRRVVLLLKRADQLGDLRGLCDLPLDRLVGAFGRLAELGVGQVEPGRGGHGAEERQRGRRIDGLGQVMRYLNGEAERIPAGLAEPQFEQGGGAAGQLDPVRQPLMPADQALAGGVRDHAERAGMRRAGRDAEEADRRAEAQLRGDGEHRLGEQVPFVIGFRPRQQREGPSARVVQQVQVQLGGLVALPVVAVIGHDRTPGPVVDQPVDVEPRQGLVREIAHQVLGEQPACVAGVDEALQVVQDRRVRDVGRGRTQLVEFLGIARHPYSLAWPAAMRDPARARRPAPRRRPSPPGGRWPGRSAGRRTGGCACRR
jgi:hypothetical protein